MSWEQWKQDAGDTLGGMYEGLQYQRGNYDELKTTLKDYGVPGLMGCGPLSDAADAAGFVGYLFAAGIKQNAVQYWENPTLYNLANLLTLGLPDTVKGAIFPEDYYGSPQNLLDIFGVASMFVPVGAVAGSAVRSGAKVVTSAGRSAMNTTRSILQIGKYAGKTVVRGPAARVVGRTGGSVRRLGAEAVCFVEGTLILTEQGLKEIQDIQIGDLVLSSDPDTGETAYKEVVNLFVNEAYELIHVSAGDEVIVTTPSHPFWVEDRGFVPAGMLMAGDMLRLSSGTAVAVGSIERESLDEPVTVYNFEVADWHTYFVSEAGVLVHNMCAANPPKGTNGYSGVRNPSVDFTNKKGNSTLDNHYRRHNGDMGYGSAIEYLEGARNFLEKPLNSTTEVFTSIEGTYFRYDLATNEFGIMNKYGGVSTYFKPDMGINYWLEQIELYKPK